MNANVNVVRAMRRCILPAGEKACKECPYYHTKGRCTTNMINDAIAIINHQKAENEQLKREIAVLRAGTFKVLCQLGDPVWFVYEDESDGWFISKNHVTKVTTKGFFVSAYDPVRDDMGCFVPYTDVGTEVFFTKSGAEERVKMLEGGDGQ